MIIKETVLRSKIRNLLLEERVYKIKELLEDITFYRDFEEDEFQKIEQRLRSNWDRGYSKYSQVIKKDVINSEEPVDHILDAIDSFIPYYSKVGPRMMQQIGQGKLSSSDLRSYAEGQAGNKLNKTRTAQREACRRQVPIRSEEECKDFKVIHADDEWVVIYPKTMLGSMSWAVGLADGSEEVYEVDPSGRQIGRVGWCTAAYESNRFPMYAGNLHMYYFVKNDGYKISDSNRRLCISLSKNENTGEVQIHYKGNATVDANNKSMSKERILSLIGQEIIEKMRADASSRGATSIAEMSSKVTLPMVKQDIENLKDDPSLLTQQLQVYAEHAKDIEVIRFFASYENPSVRASISKRRDLPEDLVRQFAQDENESVRFNISKSRDLPEDLIRQFAQDENLYVRSNIAKRSDLPEDLIRQFAQDEYDFIRITISKLSDLPEDLIRQLAQDENDVVRSRIAGNSNLPEDLIRQFAQDENDLVRYGISRNSNLPEYLFRQFAQDKHARSALASNENLPEYLIRQFAQDENESVRITISNRSDLPEDIAGQLARDKSISVQIAIQKNENITLKKEDREFLNKGEKNREIALEAYETFDESEKNEEDIIQLSRVLKETKDSLGESDKFEYMAILILNKEKNFKRKHLEISGFTPEEALKTLTYDLMALHVVTTRELVKKNPILKEIFTEDELELFYSYDRTNEAVKVLKSYINLLLN